MVLNFVAIIGIVWHIGQNHVRRAIPMEEGKDTTPHDSRIDLQPTAELDAEETRKSDMEGRDRRYELEHEDQYEIEGNYGRAELTGLNGGGAILPSSSEAHELRSEEHAQELHGNGLEVHRT